MYVLERNTHQLLREICKRFNSTEVAGCIQGNDNSQYVEIIHPFSKKIKSKRDIEDIPVQTLEKTCGVDSNFTCPVVFHTHPENCYLEYKVFLGIPSFTDIVGIVIGYQYYTHKVHIIVSLEGSYVCRVIKPLNNNSTSILKNAYNSLNTSNIHSRSKQERLNTINLFISAMNKTGILKVDFYSNPERIIL